MTVLFDLVLCALMLLAALAAIGGRGLFRATVFFVAYGITVALAWVRLGAIDVALAEAAIGAGLTGLLLLGAVARLRRAGAPEFPVRAGLVPALAAAGVAGATGWVALRVPGAGGLWTEAGEALPLSGVENPVTAVLLNFRAWDTLLESIVLLAALLAVWALAREEEWEAPVGPPLHARPGGVLEGMARLLPPVGIVVGVFLVWAGASQPGGAFQGGTVLAAVGLIAALAGLVALPRPDSGSWRTALAAGPAVFLLVGASGLALGGLLLFPPDWAKAMILTVEVFLTLSIAATLALLVLGPPQPRRMP
ncbi:hydrogenase subunit MbhD domain-containing protein [Rubellimicrobium sp. CFH 75288]|uniref:hydrogenase subunit MbhD domain-containing protein n=1 Tax=Rubellimicrobium sp. CFH 75288 TaxID=2697034 RepID=UPI00141351C0|nr:hydrogenase subunit MbhD domain-containing protein [Rubellimicrobium sp. CFH 75288]NAZ36782.1 DUF4040 domain-containing protein [Rubellimicrobium sp. CFH 75288]